MGERSIGRGGGERSSENVRTWINLNFICEMMGRFRTKLMRSCSSCAARRLRGADSAMGTAAAAEEEEDGGTATGAPLRAPLPSAPPSPSSLLATTMSTSLDWQQFLSTVLASCIVRPRRRRPFTFTISSPTISRPSLMKRKS